jgi:hypothetical protein
MGDREGTAFWFVFDVVTAGDFIYFFRLVNL